MRILIAEDETIIRLDLREILERAGFEVCAEARDGEEAVELALSEQPDLAILDVKMPRVDGIEAARRILGERPIPIVILTAYGQDELVSRAVEAGVFGYLVKPFRETDLLPAIHAARARHAELQELREEAESLAEALVTRKLVERAKGLLMAKEGLSEEELRLLDIELLQLIGEGQDVHTFGYGPVRGTFEHDIVQSPVYSRPMEEGDEVESEEGGDEPVE